MIKNVFQKQSSGNKFNLLMCTSYMPSVHPKKEFKNTDFSFKNSLGLCFSLDSRQKRLTFLFELCLLIKLGQNIIARHFILLVWAFSPPLPFLPVPIYDAYGTALIDCHICFATPHLWSRSFLLVPFAFRSL